ncbi:MAG: hypothetical protein ABJB03_01155 [Rhodoglobus sp.]
MITYSNPLHTTLAHYVRELEETLSRSGTPFAVSPTAVVEGIPGAAGKVRMMLNALSNVRSIRRTATHSNLQVWPSLGLAEIPLWHRSHGNRHFVILHDPVPLRRQFGFDPVSRWIAAHDDGPRSAVVVVHSEHAEQEARKLLPRHDLVTLPHPVLSGNPAGAVKNRTVVVAGQYKPERDIGLLRELGPRLAEIGLTGHIRGRGWPGDLAGWTIVDSFVTEPDFDRLLAEAAVVLHPYRTYFQSNVAVRALELGTLSVLPLNSFSADLFAGQAGLLYDQPSAATVLRALEYATTAQIDPAAMLGAYRTFVDGAWARAPWVETPRS